MYAITKVLGVIGRRRVQIDDRQVPFHRDLLDQRQLFIVNHVAANAAARVRPSRERVACVDDGFGREAQVMVDQRQVVFLVLLIVLARRRIPIERLGVIGAQNDHDAHHGARAGRRHERGRRDVLRGKRIGVVPKGFRKHRRAADAKIHRLDAVTEQPSQLLYVVLGSGTCASTSSNAVTHARHVRRLARLRVSGDGQQRNGKRAQRYQTDDSRHRSSSGRTYAVGTARTSRVGSRMMKISHVTTPKKTGRL